MNQSFTGCTDGNQKQGHYSINELTLKKHERRPIRAPFQALTVNETQKTTNRLNISSSLNINHLNNNANNTSINSIHPSSSNKANPITPNRHVHHSRSKSYCGGVAHYGIGSTTEIIITSKSRQVLKNKFVKEEPAHSSPSMLLSDDKENVLNADLSSPIVHKWEMPSLPALAAVKKSWQLNTPQKNSTPSKKRSSSFLSPSTPITISTSLTNIREALTPKSRARCNGCSATNKFNTYIKINSIDAISISVSEDEGTEVWCGERKGIIAIFDTNTCKPVATIYEEKEKLYVSCMCPVGEYMWAGMADGSINIYNIKKRSLVKNIHAHIGTVTDIVYLGNELIASCSVDFSIRLWESSTFTPKINCIGVRSLWVNTLCSVSGLLWSGSDDSMIRLWDTNTGIAVKEITHSPQLSKNMSVESLEPESKTNSEIECSRSKETNGVTQLCYCSLTDKVWSASRDCSVKIWNPKTYICEHSINFVTYVNCMHITGQYVWIATNKELSIWNVNDKSLVAKFPVNGFVWSIKTVGNRVWIACSDKSIRVYNINESGVTQLEKRQFQGSKRLSSEFISSDVTSPFSEFLSDVIDPVGEDEESFVNEINYDEFATSPDSKPINTDGDGTSITMQTQVLNTKGIHLTIKENSPPSKDIRTNESKITFPVSDNISIKITEMDSDISIPVDNQISTHVIPFTTITNCQNSPSSFTPKNYFPNKELVRANEQATCREQHPRTSPNSNISEGISSFVDDNNDNNHSTDSTVNIYRGLSHQMSALVPIKDSIGVMQVSLADNIKTKSEDFELQDCRFSSPSISAPSSENCHSFSNDLLLSGEIDFDGPHHQSSGCLSLIKIFGNAFKCMFSLFDISSKNAK